MRPPVTGREWCMHVRQSASSPELRLCSLDALRGFDMFWILGGGEVLRRLLMLFFGQLPPGISVQFDHAEWIGFTAWDIIMPLFLFIVGTSMPFSLAKRISGGSTKRSIYLHTLERVVILWILGMAAQGNLLGLDPSKFFFYSNTLQAIAAGYAVAVILLLHTGPAIQLAATAALLIAYWLLLAFVPVPGHGAGDLTPGGNLAMYIDTIILGRLRDGTTYTWTLSSLGFAATVMLGVFSGRLLAVKKPPYEKILYLVTAGFGCIFLGALWSAIHPIIKHIWTGSFVLYSAGWCFLLLALFYWIIDVVKVRTWAFPFRVMGVNSIVAYLLTGVTEAVLTNSRGMAAGPAIGLLYALCVVTGLWLVLYLMYYKNFFIKI